MKPHSHSEMITLGWKFGAVLDPDFDQCDDELLLELARNRRLDMHPDACINPVSVGGWREKTTFVEEIRREEEKHTARLHKALTEAEIAQLVRQAYHRPVKSVRFAFEYKPSRMSWSDRKEYLEWWKWNVPVDPAERAKWRRWRWGDTVYEGPEAPSPEWKDEAAQGSA